MRALSPLRLCLGLALCLACPPLPAAKIPELYVGSIPDQIHYFHPAAPTPLRLQLKSATLGNPSFSLPGAPAGCAVDAASGLFSYTPAADANCPFEVTVKAVSGQGSESQGFMITPAMELPEDVKCFATVNASFPAPDAESGDYLQTTDTASDAEILFNNLMRKPRTAAVSGLVVVFEKGHANGLYERFCSDGQGNLNLKELTIAAEKAVFRSPCWFPGTKVSVFAKELVFKDEGKIDTTPKTFDHRATDYDAIAKTAAKAGSQGQAGGDLRLLVRSLSVPASSAGPYFVSSGAKGQGGGWGKDGEPGKDLPTMADSHAEWPGLAGNPNELVFEHAPDKLGIYAYSSKDKDFKFAVNYAKLHTTAAILKKATLWHIGWKVWGQVEDWEPRGWKPGDGGDGKPAASGGRGGDGGSIDASIDALAPAFPGDAVKWRQQAGGAPGAIQEFLPKGGRPGNPNPAFYMEGRLTKLFIADTIEFGCRQSARKGETHFSQCGVTPSAPGLPAKSKDGAFHAGYAGKTACWVHPLAAAQAVKYIQAAYLNGRLDYVKEVSERWQAYLAKAHEEDAWFQYYSPVLDAGLDSKEKEKLANRAQAETAQRLAEVQAALSKLSSQLDAFGNPAGWTPMVSFELSLAAFRQQVDHAIDTMYLAYWLKKTSAGNQAKLDGLWRFRQLTGTKLQEAKDALDALDAKMPGLQKKLEEADALEAKTKAALEALNNKLQMEAQQTIITKRLVGTACKALGVVCSVIPYGQPALGQVGGSLGDIVTSAVNDDWAGSATAGLGGLSDFFQKSTCKSLNYNLVKTIKQDDFKKYYVKDEAMDEKEWEKKYGKKDPLGDYAKKVTAAGGGLVKSIDSLSKATGQDAVKDPEVKAEVERLVGQCPEVKTLGDKVLELAGEKRDAVAELLQACQELDGWSNQLSYCLMALDSVNQQLIDRQAAVSPRLDSYLDGLSKRAEEDLVKYHYFMKKAYEYRILQEYPAELDLSPLRQQIVKLVEANAGSSLSQDQFNQLKTLYNNVIWNICGKLYEDIASLRKATERDAETVYELHQAQLDALNRGETLELDLAATGLFAGEQGLRLRDLQVEGLQVALAPGASAPRNANFSVYITHSGVSDLSAPTGETFRFRHYNASSGDNKLVWGAKYTHSTGAVTQIVPSVAEASLLKAILTDKGLPHTDADLPIYCWPALDATLRIAKSQENKERKNGRDTAISDSEDCFLVTSLKLKVKYSLLLQSSAVRELTVKSEDGLSPTILVSPADSLGNGSGRASFTRFYAPGSSVTLTAPAQYGPGKFVRWADGQGDSSAFADPTNPVLSGLTINANRTAVTVVAKYAFTAAGRIAGLGSAVATIAVIGRDSTQLAYVEDETQGLFQISGLQPDTYTLVPSCPGFVFEPDSRVVEIGSQDASGLDFAATPSPAAALTVRGKVRIRDGGGWSPFGDATLLLAGADGRQRLAYSSGRDGTFLFDGLEAGGYTLTPSFPPYSFATAGAQKPRFEFTLAKAMDFGNCQNLIFNASATPVEPVRVETAGIAGVTVSAAGAGDPLVAVTGNDGGCSFALTPGEYTFTPVKTGYSFSPASKRKKIDGKDTTTVEFAATPSNAKDALAISGRVDGLPPGRAAAVRLHLKSGVQATAATSSDGGFAFAAVPAGDYIVVPAAGGYSFRPQTKAVSANASLVFQARRVAAAGDFDGDGKADALWTSSDGRRHAAKLLLEPFSPCSIVATGDFDGDGVCEVLARPSATRGPFWLHSPSTQQRRPLWSGLRPTVGVAAVGDFDGDGDTDILWRDAATGETRLDTALQGWDLAPRTQRPRR